MKWLNVLVVLCALLSASQGNLVAAEKSYSISIKIFKSLENVYELVELEQHEEALVILQELLEKRLTLYEKAQIYSLMGSVYYKESDLPLAISSFKKVLESEDDMPLALHVRTLKTLSQLNLVIEDYQQARTYCEKVISIAGDILKPIDYTLLAQANYKLEDWEPALQAAIDGRNLALSQQLKPKENLLLLLNAIHFELGQLEKMTGVLEELIRNYPKTNYMLYLASVYGQLERLDKQTVLMESLYEDGRITEGAQLRNLASLYLSEQAPYKGAVVLEKALQSGALEANAKNFEMLAQAWRFSAEREKAIVSLGEAAKLSDSGDNYLHKAYMHFDMAQWQDAEESLKAGFKQGISEKLLGEAWLLMGMTLFKMKEYDNAIKACEQAKNYQKSAKNAGQWISYISGEQRKVESMQQMFN